MGRYSGEIINKTYFKESIIRDTINVVKHATHYFTIKEKIHSSEKRGNQYTL